MHTTAEQTSPASPAATSPGGGTLYLVLIQITSRAFTFLGNQILLRYLSPSLLGLAVQLELVSVTVLYFSRESLRVALQRQPVRNQGKQAPGSTSQQVVNLGYIATGIGLIASTGLGYGYLQNSSSEVLESDDFWVSFQLYAVATIIELLAEPCFLIIQQHALYKARARAETAAALARCVAACVAAIVMRRYRSPASVLPFAIGQIFYAIALIITYLAAVIPLTKKEGFFLIPRHMTLDSSRKPSSQYWLGLFSKPLLSLTITFYAQSVFKLLLTQGDSLILSFLTDLKAQGAFALASNYGGLLSRLIFQPVEESSRNVFGRLLSPPTNTSQTSKNDNQSSTTPDLHKQSISDNIESQTKVQSKSKSNTLTPQHQALSHLTTTLHLYILFALPLLTLVPPLLPTLTSVLLAPQWRTLETTALLRAYVTYIPFLAINGVLDAFVTTVATPSQLRDQSLLMAGITAVYGGIAWLLMGRSVRAVDMRAMIGLSAAMGSPGLVYANVVNMLMRIVYSVVFIRGWVAGNMENSGRSDSGRGEMKRLVLRSLPGLSCMGTALVVGLGLKNILHTHASHGYEKAAFGLQGLDVQEIGYILGGVVVLGTSIILSEHQFLIDLVVPLMPQRLAAMIQPYLPKSSKKQE